MQMPDSPVPCATRQNPVNAQEMPRKTTQEKSLKHTLREESILQAAAAEAAFVRAAWHVQLAVSVVPTRRAALCR